MRLLRLVAAAAASLAAAAGASAQTVGIGTTQGGATNQVATAIAAIVSSKSPVQMRPQPHALTSQYIPLVNAGRLEFGISNVAQFIHALRGEGMSEGRPKATDLRLAATLFPFEVSLYVTRKSGIASLAGLKGKRVPHFDGQELGYYLIRGLLEMEGVKYEEVNRIPLPNFPRMWDAFKDGSVDVMIAAYASRPVIEAKATHGEVDALSIDPTPAKMAILQKWLPETYAILRKPDPKVPGVNKDTQIMAFDYTLWVHKDVKDEVVYGVVKAMFDHAKDLRSGAALWADFDEKKMAKPNGAPFHPGATKFYVEKGLSK